jgi:probable phosphoglycerate mutase
LEKIVYIIRHGQTDLNRHGIVQGRGIDSPLNDTGHLQAHAFYQAYKDEGFDRIYTSTLQRTVQTIQPFINDGIPHVSLSGLDEISWGIYEGKNQDPALIEGFNNLIERWRSGELDAAVEGGESPAQLIERQKVAMDAILSAPEDGKILICMHGRAMRILLSWLVLGDASQMDTFQHTNTSLYKIKFDVDAPCQILDAYNIAHLEALSK